MDNPLGGIESMKEIVQGSSTPQYMYFVHTGDVLLKRIDARANGHRLEIIRRRLHNVVFICVISVELCERMT